MTKVFVSHASVDLALACKVRRWFIEAGHHVFLRSTRATGILPEALAGLMIVLLRTL